MPTHIAVFQKKVDYSTGEELLDESGVPIMEHVRDIIVPDPLVFQLSLEELAQQEAEYLQQTGESATTEDLTQNP
jgi:hypothetical protein